MARRVADPAPPRSSAPDLPAVLDAAARVERRSVLTAVRLSGLTGHIDAAHSHIVESLWDAPAADLLDLTGAVLTDVRLTDPRITELVAREGRWRDVEIVGGRIGTIDLLRAELDGVVLRDVRIDYLAMPSAHVAHVRVIDCEIGTLDLPEARIDRVAFERSRVDEVDTRGMRAAHLDLRGLAALSYTDPPALRGATLTPAQAETHAAAFAAALGIRLQD